jgi:ligand-binding sensor domain-containing protein
MRSLIQRIDLPRRLRNRRSVFLVAAGALLIPIAAVLLWVVLDRNIEHQRDKQLGANRVEVQESALRPPATDGWTLHLNSSDVRGVALFAGVRYLATSGGLIALDEGGNVKRRFTTLDGLPENDLTALAVFRERLIAGTSSYGLVSFDGQSFTGYRFVKPKASHVSVLVSTESELLIGTLDGGLFEFDGQRFSRRYNSTSGGDFKQVTALLPVESRLYVGTQDDGLYIWREAHIEHLGTNEGLPSPHVTGLAPMPGSISEKGKIAVGTDFGVVGLDEGNTLKVISTRPNITSLSASGDRLWAGLFSGGIVDLSANDSRSTLSQTSGLPKSSPAVVYASDGGLWALTRVGAYFRDEEASGPAFEAVGSALAGDRLLTATHITAVKSDGTGRLWVGYFDRGIDLIDPESGERLQHIEDDRVREINHLAFDPADDRVVAATSRGLVIFGNGLKQTTITRDQGGLVNDSIAHVLLAEIDSPLLASTGAVPLIDRERNRSIVVSTAGGLTEIIGGRARSITAFHGLASNHLYTSDLVGRRLFVGTLAGLVELDGLRVTHTYKTANSRLSHDWVNALAEADGTLFIGTNGGGVDALLPTGEWVNFSDVVGKFEVNQNAMHLDGERLYVGTSDRGLFVYNTRDRRWNRISAGLASQNVTAITSNDRFVYIGTLNGLVRIEKRVIQ